MANKNYSTIEVPYNDYLERSDSVQFDSLMSGDSNNDATSASVPAGNLSTGADNTITDGKQLEDLWISNWIKSANYKPKTQGFLFDAKLGYIEANKLYIGSGGIVGGSLHIPDEDTTANSFHVESDGDTFWGCTQSDFTADNDNANAYILKTGSAKLKDVILSTNVILSGLQSGSDVDGQYLSANSVASASAKIAMRGWTISCVFSATDYNTVEWTSGNFVASDGTNYSINSGNTGDIAAVTYIYLDIDVSTTALQTTTTLATAVGNGKVLIGVAEDNSDTTSNATFQIFGGKGGNSLLVDNLAANSASTNEFVSNTAQIANLIVTNAKINDLAVDKLTAGTITSKAIVLAVSDGTGDSYIAAGKSDFTNVDSGFILGIDDSDANKAKFYIGSSSKYLNIVPTDGILLFTGDVTIGTGNNVFKADSNGIYLGNATFASAPFRVNMAGDLVASSATITGALTTGVGSSVDGQYLSANSVASASAKIAMRGWTLSCVFSPTDYNTVEWTSGNFVASDGTNYSINSGNTGDISAVTYIYLDIDVSTTALQTTTTLATAVGNGKVLIGVAENNSDTTSNATFQIFGGKGGQSLLVDNLAANSASTNEFVSNTAQIANLIVTNAKINDLAVSKLTAGTITSKIIDFAISEGSGDAVIRWSKTDFGTAEDGMIIGFDDSDSNNVKIEMQGSTGSMSMSPSGISINDNVVLGSTQGTSAINVETGANKINQEVYAGYIPSPYGCVTTDDNYIYILELNVNRYGFIYRYKISSSGRITIDSGDASNALWLTFSAVTYEYFSGISRLGDYLYCWGSVIGDAYKLLRITISDKTITEMTISGTAPSDARQSQACDGTYIYITSSGIAAATSLYKYSISGTTATYESTITMPDKINGISCDETYFYMTTSNAGNTNNDNIYKTNLSGTNQSNFRMPVSNYFCGSCLQNNVLQGITIESSGAYMIVPFGM